MCSSVAVDGSLVVVVSSCPIIITVSPETMPDNGLAGFSLASDVCTHVISMPQSVDARNSVIQGLGRQGITEVKVWTGLLAQEPEQLSAAADKAAAACLVPPSYAEDVRELAFGELFRKYRGTVASSLSHLQLLRHVWLASNASSSGSSAPPCTWALVLADDVVFQPTFREWVESLAQSVGRTADLINLAVVRAWGEAVAEQSPATEQRPKTRGAPPNSVARAPQLRAPFRRVEGELVHSMWGGMRAPFGIRSPNLLVSAYLVKISTLPVLLSAFGRTQRLSGRCSVDQVLARVEYALASTGQYRAYNYDVVRSHVAHCAVGPEEVELWKRAYPTRHAACLSAHPLLYGNGSRSHSRRHARRRLQEAPAPSAYLVKPAALKKETQSPAQADAAGASADRGCPHTFRVPADRVGLEDGQPQPEGRADGMRSGTNAGRGGGGAAAAAVSAAPAAPAAGSGGGLTTLSPARAVARGGDAAAMLGDAAWIECARRPESGARARQRNGGGARGAVEK